MRATPPAAEIVYPDSDGKPMAESDLHRDWMVTNIRRFKRFFAGQRVYVSGNLLVYYEEGNPKRSFEPDTFVVKDCDPRRRRIFKIWEEGKVPHFILETTSSSTRREDQGKKKRLYEELRVPEYFLYDPLGEWLKPPLQGHRLGKSGYERIEADAEGRIDRQQLGISFQLEDGQLEMVETATGKRLLCDEEAAAEEARHAAEEARQAAEEARRAAEAIQRAAEEVRRAAEANQRAADVEERLAREIAARQALEQELARLRRAKGK
jgi:Uma2 family endonuclease